MPSATSIFAKCQACATLIKLDRSTINKTICRDEDGRSIFLTYYDCHECGKRYFVQADDNYSMEMLSNVSKTFVRLASAKQKGRIIRPKQREKFNRLRSHLDRYRTKLMREWSNKNVTDVASGNVYTLEFVTSDFSSLH